MVGGGGGGEGRRKEGERGGYIEPFYVMSYANCTFMYVIIRIRTLNIAQIFLLNCFAKLISYMYLSFAHIIIKPCQTYTS
jgi:hypothetical protein